MSYGIEEVFLSAREHNFILTGSKNGRTYSNPLELDCGC